MKSSEFFFSIFILTLTFILNFSRLFPPSIWSIYLLWIIQISSVCMENVQRLVQEAIVSTCIPRDTPMGCLGGGWLLSTLYGVSAHQSPPPHHPRQQSFHSTVGGSSGASAASSWSCISVCEQITPVIRPCRKLQFCSSWKIKILSWSDGRKRMRQLKWAQPLWIRQKINYAFSWLRGSMENLREKSQKKLRLNLQARNIDNALWNCSKRRLSPGNALFIPCLFLQLQMLLPVVWTLVGYRSRPETDDLELTSKVRISDEQWRYF